MLKRNKDTNLISKSWLAEKVICCSHIFEKKLNRNFCQFGKLIFKNRKINFEGAMVRTKLSFEKFQIFLPLKWRKKNLWRTKNFSFFWQGNNKTQSDKNKCEFSEELDASLIYVWKWFCFLEPPRKVFLGGGRNVEFHYYDWQFFSELQK